MVSFFLGLSSKNFPESTGSPLMSYTVRPVLDDYIVELDILRAPVSGAPVPFPRGGKQLKGLTDQ